MDILKFDFMVEKREGCGEDSDPLSFSSQDGKFHAVGVFDGMGGAGAAICQSRFGNSHTKAYVASRIVGGVIAQIVADLGKKDITDEYIKEEIKNEFQQEKEKYLSKESGLRSKLVRDYPTTLAFCTIEESDIGKYILTSYWAGDSRNYLWTSEGFYQLSKDDLEGELDPLQNIRNDAAMSNCVCADRKFRINVKRVEVKAPLIVFSATDGCFGYFPTPMHFENVLFSGLKEAKDMKEWKEYVQRKIECVTSDDISMSLLILGSSFEEIKNLFSEREVPGFGNVSAKEREIAELEEELRKKRNELEEVIQEGWNTYKVDYLHYINFNTVSDSSERECEKKSR